MALVLKPHTVMMLRSHFAKVTGWRSPVFEEANSFSRAIEVVMNTLLLKSRLEDFNWQFEAMCSNSGPQIVTVPMSLVKGNWKVSHHDIEAILSLWIFSMNNAPRGESCPQNTDITTDRPGVHLLGLDHHNSDETSGGGFLRNLRKQSLFERVLKILWWWRSLLLSVAEEPRSKL